MIFGHCSIIQEGEAALFYRFNKPLNGYMIAGLLVAPNPAAKMAFIVAGTENTLFENYLTYHSTLENGLKIYKVDNFLKDKYSTFAKHVENKTSV